MEQPGQMQRDSQVLKRLRRMRQGVITSSRLIQGEFCDEGQHCSMFFLTLTYRPTAEWDADQIGEFIGRMRKYFARDGRREWGYVWKLELTDAGRPHYHVALFVRGHVYLPKLDEVGYWTHGFTRVERARNATGYLAKYLAKQDIRELPKGARLWGFGGLSGESRGSSGESRGSLRWWRAPRWLRVRTRIDEGVRRLKRGWWQCLATNYCYRSPYHWDYLAGKVLYLGWDWEENVDVSGEVARLGGDCDYHRGIAYELTDRSQRDECFAKAMGQR